MAVKDEILSLLEENRDGFVSGQEIADRLNVTRAAIWKAIKALEKDGYDIEAVTNRGYRLGRTPDIIDAAYIEAALKEAGLNVRVIYKDETGSTNEDALAALRDGIPDGSRQDDEAVLVIADKQNAGRGRRGRDFYSPKGTGLYMSLALPDVQRLLKTVKLTAIAATAVAEAIDEQVFNGAETTLIKWVNDIYLGDKKVCGILCEAFLPMEDEDRGCIVAGIGINVQAPSGDFPQDIKDKAGYLIDDDTVPADNTDQGLRSRLAAAVIKRLYHYIDEPDNALSVYRNRSNLMGCTVRINSFASNGEDKEALVKGIDDEYRLLVEYPDGSREALSSGEVSVIKNRPCEKSF